MFPITLIHEKAIQRGLEYLIIGGHALNAYCEPRATLDVDILARKGDQESWTELLKAEGFRLQHGGPAFLQFLPPHGVEWRLDVMLVNAETFRKMLQASRSANLLGLATRIPSPEHLLALKLHALKHGHPQRYEKDFLDVLSLTRNTGLDPRSESYRQLFAQYGTLELYERILQRLD